MLPEHVQALEKYAREKEKEKSCQLPEYDEQLLEQWNRLLRLSAETKAEIKVTLLSGGQKKQLSGQVAWTKESEGRIGLQTEEGLKSFYAKDIIWLEQA